MAHPLKNKNLQKLLDSVLIQFIQSKNPMFSGEEYLEEFYKWEMETTVLVGDYVFFLN
jgi:hypothetical protein